MERIDTPGPLDMQAWLDRPWEMSTWADELGLGPLVQSSLTDHAATVSKTLAKLSPAALAAWVAEQELQVTTAAYYRPDTSERAHKALKRASTTPFGAWLQTSPLGHDAQIMAWVADHSKSASKGE